MFGKVTAGELHRNHEIVDAADAAPYQLPTLIIGIAASVGIVVGSIAPWLWVFVISANGLDIDGWGNATLTLGAASGIALVSQWDSVRTTSSIRWAAPSRLRRIRCWSGMSGPRGHQYHQVHVDLDGGL
jgi:hypothetical protein